MRLLAVALASLALAATARADEIDAAALWTKQCKSCHGLDGKGQTEQGKKLKLEDLSTAEWQGKPKHTDAFIKDVIANGIKDTKMKAYKEKLSEAEIDALVKHVRSLKQ
jgi:mono/diheme cytochrome c family protein